jgi:hypothetical protein
MTLNSVPRFLTLILLLAAVSATCWANTYDAAADFEAGWLAQTNPNGVWSYGYSGGFTNTISLYTNTVQNGVNGPNAQYWLTPNVDIGTSPAAEYNNGPAYNDGNVNFLPNEFLLVSGIGGQYSNLIFTAPASGMYSIVSSFRGAQYGIGVAIGVVINGSTVWQSTINAEGQIVPYNATLPLTSGETVVFSVGPNGGLQNTGLAANISQVTQTPEPTSIALLGTGVAALLRRRRRSIANKQLQVIQ